MSKAASLRPRAFVSAVWLLSAAFALSVGCTASGDDSSTRDTDHDGIPDASDPDIDGDGLANAVDPDVDGDGIPNEQDPDFNTGTGGTTGGDDGVVVDGDGTTGTGGTAPTECVVVDGVEKCTCFKLMTWGALGQFGAVPGQDGQDAISNWLNENSSGEASYSAAKPAITADYLAPYKVLIIQDVSAWAPFTTEEQAAVKTWVEGGGGIISLQGYGALSSEVNNVNSLLAFTGMSYAPSDTDTEADRDAALTKTCTDCLANSVPQAGWSAHPIGLNLTKVGGFYGRPVVPGAATVVASDAKYTYGAAGEYGTGRVFLFHDEWVTYNSQWTGTGAGVRDCSTVATCEAYTIPLQYNIPQFWYNSLKWLSNLECFTIDDPQVVK